MPLPNTSHEHLVHFNCPLCQKWWSIGDAPERDHWYCPWCGDKLSEEAPGFVFDGQEGLIKDLLRRHSFREILVLNGRYIKELTYLLGFALDHNHLPDQISDTAASEIRKWVELLEKHNL